MEQALSKGGSFGNRLFVEWFLYGNGLFAFWNRLVIEWFLYGKGLFVKGIPDGKGSL